MPPCHAAAAFQAHARTMSQPPAPVALPPRCTVVHSVTMLRCPNDAPQRQPATHAPCAHLAQTVAYSQPEMPTMRYNSPLLALVRAWSARKVQTRYVHPAAKLLRRICASSSLRLRQMMTDRVIAASQTRSGSRRTAENTGSGAGNSAPAPRPLPFSVAMRIDTVRYGAERIP